MGRIKSIHYKEGQKGFIETLEIEVNDGVFVAKTPHRQISFITLKGEEKLKEDVVVGYCHSRFKANFVVTELDISKIKVANQLEIGEAIVEVTEVGKECHRSCPATSEESPCGVGGEIFFARIIRGGKVKKEDELKYL